MFFVFVVVKQALGRRLQRWIWQAGVKIKWLIKVRDDRILLLVLNRNHLIWGYLLLLPVHNWGCIACILWCWVDACLLFICTILNLWFRGCVVIGSLTFLVECRCTLWRNLATTCSRSILLSLPWDLGVCGLLSLIWLVYWCHSVTFRVAHIGILAVVVIIWLIVFSCETLVFR